MWPEVARRLAALLAGVREGELEKRPPLGCTPWRGVTSWFGFF